MIFGSAQKKQIKTFVKHKGTVEDILKDLVENDVQNSDNRNMPLKDLI